MTAGGNSFKNATTAHKVNSYYTLAISYCTFCVGKHTILGPASHICERPYCSVLATTGWQRPSTVWLTFGFAIGLS